MMKHLLFGLKVRRVIKELKKQGMNTNFFGAWHHTNLFDCYSVEAWVNTWYNGLFKKKMTAEEVWAHVKTQAMVGLPIR